MTLGRFDESDVDLGGGPPHPGGHSDSRSAAAENEDSMAVWHDMVLRIAWK